MRLLAAALAAAAAAVRAQQPLPLNSLSTVSAPASLFALPASLHLTVSLALCTADASDARFFLSGTELHLHDGSAQWSGPAPSGGLLSVQNLTGGSFQVSVSDNGTTYAVLDELPLLGDTTASQAILFSHPVLPAPVTKQPSYPNYTLQPARLAAPDAPASLPNLTLVLAPTSAQLSSLPQTACALLSAPSTGSIIGSAPWLRDTQGWRTQWLVDGLAPSTNYTAYVVQDTLQVAGPIYLTTKSATFPCPLVYSLPYCPSTAYAVPLPPLLSPAFGYNSTILPDALVSPLLSYMANMSTMLATFACGRDLYSPLQTCADCQARYRTWLCAVSFPRCSEPAPGDDPSLASASALLPQPSGSPSRNPFFPNASYDYAALLPCLETCNAVDRACPYFLGIKCPTPKFNAAASYGVGFIDGGHAGEVVGGGRTGVAQDRWGNVWCNGN